MTSNKIKPLCLSLCLFFLQCLTSICSFAQAPVIQWQKCIGGIHSETGIDMIQTADSGFIFVGDCQTPSGDVIAGPGAPTNKDYWIVKVNKLGNIQWTRRYGTTKVDYVRQIKQTTDGGYIVIGATQGMDNDVSFNHDTTSFDIWVIKLHSGGNIEWEKCYGGGPNVGEHGFDITQTSDGGYVIAGSSGPVGGDVTINHGSGDYWLIKINATGTIQWQKSYGGTGQDALIKVENAHGGGYLMAGYTASQNTGQVTGNHGGQDVWVVKVNDTGMIEWQKCYGSTGDDKLSDLIVTNEGYLLGGRPGAYNGDISGNTNGAFWVVSINDLGNIIWQKTYGGFGEYETRLSKTNDGHFLISGYTFSKAGTGDVVDRWDTILQSQIPSHPGYNLTTKEDAWMLKITSSGAMVWQKTLGGRDRDTYNHLVSTFDGGYCTAITTGSVDGDVVGNHGAAGSGDIWLVKLHHPAGIDEAITTNYQMQLSPNPASSSFKLQYELGGAEEVSILLTDSKGRLLRTYRQQGKRGGNTFQINEPGLATGIYFVTLQTASGKQSLMLQQW